MRLLLSYENFAAFGGTETYNLTVALELERLGHDVSIYAPNRGEMAEFAGRQGIRVLRREALPENSDAVISSDAATCHELAGRFPGTVHIFIAHSRDYPLQAPPPFSDRCQAVVVLNDRVRRAVQARGWHAPVVRLRQPISELRFQDRGPFRPAAKRVLVLSNQIEGARARLVQSACRAGGFELSWVGGASASPTPELAIADADIVIGLGRSVLEGMAGGRAAYVYGLIGGDGWVTPERYPAMEADGFAGTSAGDVIVDAERLASDLGSWNDSMGLVNRDLVQAHHTVGEHAAELVDLVRRLSASAPREPSHGDEFARLVRLQREAESQAAIRGAEADRLRSHLVQRDLAAATLQAQLAEALADHAARERLEALQSSRRYRLACRIAEPLDRIRRVGGMARGAAEK